MVVFNALGDPTTSIISPIGFDSLSPTELHIDGGIVRV